MPVRSEWKGFLQINQLRVPIKAFSAADTRPGIVLNKLHRDCGERIRQQQFCPHHGAVEPEQIVPGYQVAENCYLPMNPAEIEQLRPEPDKTIAVECFVDRQTIDPIFHSGRTLYLIPDGPPGQRPFSILREGMAASGRHAFSRVVMSRRERLVVLRPFGRLLAMTLMKYPQRIRPAAEHESEIATRAPSDQELALAGKLIDAMTDHDFEFSRYRDRYLDGLSSLIEQRIATADLTAETPFARASSSQGTTDETMVAILEASLRAAGIPEGSPPPLKAPSFSTSEDQHDRRLA